MHNRSFTAQNVVSVTKPASSSEPKKASTVSPANPGNKDDLARAFHTAVVSSQTATKRDFSAELYELTESPSFQAIMTAIRHLARVQGIQERQAAEQVIQTFRKVDEIWGEYLFREGVERMRQRRV